MNTKFFIQRKGMALFATIFVLALIFSLGVILSKIVYNTYVSVRATTVREQAFYLAEAGLEKGKAALANNPNWYTDLPVGTPDKVVWLINSAVGQETILSNGRFKIVREKAAAQLYALGIKQKGLVVLKIEFSTSPLKFSSWEAL
ncbi:hypothetical protein COT42_00970 [Candidatus Saganbacteria bacterium CG08_land_8_20_14_0_20_45_16]|uniref:Type 4 fimbrial biogenesis protein PilX N-terminal domain-containing protein n=1 Tax=Candidatus Saganbacteria bacterium CG08_land_8_20_14_0_20_45_16 TaxID=2014293 RepID=A0A2H0Y1J5_UNCSA|nr:MAG: hypothetical protein COT42_00970 [Candidatus Saganbacteria bacterium CG08_land_8_20_14_0_20_45_16]